MPGGDRTGPMGAGSMTGRGAGFCGGFGVPGYMKRGPGWGRGFGRGWGRGLGWRAWGFRGGFGNPWYGNVMPVDAPYAAPWVARPLTREEELDYLRSQAGALQEELDAINARVSEIESGADAGEEE